MKRIRSRFTLLLVSLSILSWGPVFSFENFEYLDQKILFQSGEGGYHTYRIPAVVVTPKGTVLVFCEGRLGGAGDAGNIDLLMKRSLDNGATWEAVRTLVDEGGDTCGNPAPVVDRETGTVWLLFTRNAGSDTEGEILKGNGTRDIWVMKSEDDGLTWSEPAEISKDVREAEWRWYATGPGHGIQLQDGTLMIACDHSLSPDHSDWRSHVIFSADRGKTWSIGGVVPGGYTNESTLAELPDGRLYLNMRSYAGHHRRAVSISRDNGKTWSTPKLDEALIEPVCQAAVLSVKRGTGMGKDLLLFSNPASEKREGMTIRISDDQGETWPKSLLLHSGPSAYSDLGALPDGSVACIYEKGEKGPYESVVWERMNLVWLIGE